MLAAKPVKLTPTRILTARHHLRAADPVMKAIIDAVGPYTLRFERDRFAMLVRSIAKGSVAGRLDRMDAAAQGRSQDADGLSQITRVPFQEPEEL